jgi:hypothetical protein
MAAAAWATDLLGAQTPLARLVAMAMIFAVTFLLPLLAIDRELRGRLAHLWRNRGNAE